MLLSQRARGQERIGAAGIRRFCLTKKSVFPELLTTLCGNNRSRGHCWSLSNPSKRIIPVKSLISDVKSKSDETPFQHARVFGCSRWLRAAADAETRLTVFLPAPNCRSSALHTFSPPAGVKITSLFGNKRIFLSFRHATLFRRSRKRKRHKIPFLRRIGEGGA